MPLSLPDPKVDATPGVQRNLDALASAFPLNGSQIQNGQISEDKLADAVAARLVPTGSVVATARATAPSDWLLCDGSAISRTTYADLFTAISTTYGVGDGSTTFNLPDLRGRVPVGVDGAAARLSANDALGNSAGTETHTLTTAELPSHTHGTGTLAIGNNNADHKHSQDFATGAGGSAGKIPPSNDITATTSQGTMSGVSSNHQHPITGATGSSGSGTAHNNLQPYQVLNYIIKT